MVVWCKLRFVAIILALLLQVRYIEHTMLGYTYTSLTFALNQAFAQRMRRFEEKVRSHTVYCHAMHYIYTITVYIPSHTEGIEWW